MSAKKITKTHQCRTGGGEGRTRGGRPDQSQGRPSYGTSMYVVQQQQQQLYHTHLPVAPLAAAYHHHHHPHHDPFVATIQRSKQRRGRRRRALGQCTFVVLHTTAGTPPLFSSCSSSSSSIDIQPKPDHLDTRVQIEREIEPLSESSPATCEFEKCGGWVTATTTTTGEKVGVSAIHVIQKEKNRGGLYSVHDPTTTTPPSKPPPCRYRFDLHRRRLHSADRFGSGLQPGCGERGSKERKQNFISLRFFIFHFTGACPGVNESPPVSRCVSGNKF